MASPKPANSHMYQIEGKVRTNLLDTFTMPKPAVENHFGLVVAQQDGLLLASSETEVQRRLFKGQGQFEPTRIFGAVFTPLNYVPLQTDLTVEKVFKIKTTNLPEAPTLITLDNDSVEEQRTRRREPRWAIFWLLMKMPGRSILSS